MAAGYRVSYGSSPRQYVEIYPSTTKDNQNTPLIIFIHGGGWYSGSTTDHEDLANYISTNTNIAVALVDYRITLKDKPEENTIYHPAHLTDVHAALELLYDKTSGHKYKYDITKSILVGHSAGGWMVLSAALASETNQSSYHSPVADMPPIKASIRKAIRAFVAVESIFSLVDLVKTYPSYDTFIVPAFYPPSVKARPPYRTLEKAGAEAWPLAPLTGYYNAKQPRIYIIHSSEDNLLDAEYNTRGVDLLRQKGLDPIIDNDTFKGDHDHLLHTTAFWQRLISIMKEVL